MFLFPQIYFTPLSIATLNINRLNNEMKQLQLINFVKYNKIDILFIQEHNIRKENVICEKLLDEFHFELNYAIALKGGTAIMINKKIPLKILSGEKSRII